MAQPLTNTPAVNAAISAAQDLPSLISGLSAINPELANQLQGKALIASKTVWGVILGMLLAHLAGKYGLNLPADDISYVDGGVVILLTTIFRSISTAPITSWFSNKPAASPAEVAQKVAALIMAALMVNLLAACATFQADAALIAQKVAQNAAAIRAFCDNKVLPAANSPLTAIALAAADALPYGADLTLARNATVATCQNIDAAAVSLTTLPWMQSQLPVLTGSGKVAAPAPIAPAPVTATSEIPVS